MMIQKMFFIKQFLEINEVKNKTMFRRKKKEKVNSFGDVKDITIKKVFLPFLRLPLKSYSEFF